MSAPVKRIGVNALYLIPGGVGGTEIYLRSLLEALAGIDRENQYFVLTNRETGADLVPRAANFHLAAQNVAARNRPARILYELFALPIAVRRLKIDVLFNPGFTSPLLSGCPQVTVFHDLQHKRHPEHFRWFDLPFWRMLLWLSAHRARTLIAVSAATARDLDRFYSLTNIVTIPHGVDPAFFDLAAQPANTILTVSTLHPHKNLENLLRAFAGFHRTRPEYRLIVAGLRGFHADALERLRDQLELRECVTFTGWIAREHLYALFGQARAFIYPSTFEGFGMPILEAMAAGIPTACSNIEPLASIAGDAALQFDPADVNAIRGAMERLVSDELLRRQLAEAGRARASQFTWQAAARATLDTLRKACG